jgi:hypothetical protein
LIIADLDRATFEGRRAIITQDVQNKRDSALVFGVTND